VSVRHSVNAMHYNEAYLGERGLNRPPQVIDELVEYARRLTFTRLDGTQVHGWGIQAGNYSNVASMARACGGDLINENMECVADGPGMVRTLEMLREMYQGGMMPRNITAMKQNDMITAIQNGQVAMQYFPFGRTVLFNNPRSSRFPGRFGTAFCLNSREGATRNEINTTAEFWCMTIPRNGRAKDMAWSLIKEISSKENAIRAAMNGNQPARVSAYADPQLLANVSYAAKEAQSLMPYAISEVVAVAIWKFMLDPQIGGIARTLAALGLPDFDWATNPTQGLILVCLISIWLHRPFTFIIIYAAMLAVPKELYEAAKIDGASPMQRFRYVTLPGIAGAVLVALIFRYILSFRLFSEVWLLTAGGPARMTEVLAVYLYKQAFTYASFGIEGGDRVDHGGGLRARRRTLCLAAASPGLPEGSVRGCRCGCCAPRPCCSSCCGRVCRWR
jgi:hypothetical protein